MENQYFKNFTVDEVQKNRENVLYALESLQKMQSPVFNGVEISDTGFNMVIDISTEETVEDFSGKNCGTVACIAGWAMTIAAVTHSEMVDTEVYVSDETITFHSLNGDFIDVIEGAEEFLGLNTDSALKLFMPKITNSKTGYSYSWNTDPEVFSLEAAVYVMTSLVETGEFSWLEAIKSAESTPANVLAELSEGEWE